MNKEDLLKEIKVLNHGFVRLVDFMGDDAAIVQAARVSYGKGTKTLNEDKGLIDYLIRNKHTTPLEMVEFKFHCQMPILTARQWIRHRTASVNEYSMRYSEATDEYYIPELDQIRKQSKSNKQGREEQIQESDAVEIQNIIKQHSESSYSCYKNLLELGLARELARSVLPVNFYTKWYWKIDLHNLFHFLRLRLDSHAQYEIRVYAQAMYDLIKSIVPMACESFENHILNAKNFSSIELKSMAGLEYPQKELTDRQFKEFINKFV